MEAMKTMDPPRRLISVRSCFAIWAAASAGQELVRVSVQDGLTYASALIGSHV